MNERAELNDYLKGVLQGFTEEFIRDRTAALRKRGAVASGSLARSLSAEVRAQATGAGVEALIAFDESGRFIDMKRMQPAAGGADYIAEIIRWIQEKGLEEKMIQGYTSKRGLVKLPERVLTYIAFGIARKRFNGKYRRTRWYNKAKTAKISALYDEVIAGIPDIIMEELKKGFDPSPRQASQGGGSSSGGSSGGGGRRRYDYASVRGRQ